RPASRHHPGSADARTSLTPSGRWRSPGSVRGRLPDRRRSLGPGRRVPAGSRSPPGCHPLATLPSYLDDDARHVVCLGTPGPLADLVQEGGHDFARWFVAVGPDHLEGTPNAEPQAIARGRLDDPVGKQEDEVTRFQADRRAIGEIAGSVK